MLPKSWYIVKFAAFAKNIQLQVVFQRMLEVFQNEKWAKKVEWVSECVRETETERQRQKDRHKETERQRDRETERQRDREKERQRDRERERRGRGYTFPSHPSSLFQCHWHVSKKKDWCAYIFIFIFSFSNFQSLLQLCK